MKIVLLRGSDIKPLTGEEFRKVLQDYVKTKKRLARAFPNMERWFWREFRKAFPEFRKAQKRKGL